MSFTRAKNPAKDSGFNLMNWKSTLGDLTGYVLFLSGVLLALGIAQNAVMPRLNSFLSNLTNGALSASSSGGAWEGW